MKNDKDFLDKDEMFSSDCRDQSPPFVKPCKPDSIDGFFDRFAKAVTRFAGSPIMFSVAVLAVLVWALSGPYFKLFGNLAANYQYRHHHYYVFNGVLDSAKSKQGQQGHTHQAR